MGEYLTNVLFLTSATSNNPLYLLSSDFEAQIKAWDTVTARLSAEDPFFKKVVDSQRAWSKRVAKYMFLNEADYLVGYEHVHGKIPGMS